MEATRSASSPLNGDGLIISHARADALCAACRSDELKVVELSVDDNAALRDAVTLLHECAARAKVDGILCMTCIDPKTEKPLVRHFAIGEVEGMVTEAATRGQFSNVYVALAILHKNLPAGKRGTAEHIVAILGSAIDDDGDVAGKRAERPFEIQETVLVQTSSNPTLNLQPWYLFSRALPPKEAKELTELTYRKCGGDYGAKDIAHIWRVPDILNFPTKKKLERGRPEHPQAVQLVGGSFEFIDPDHLRRSLEAMPDRHPPRISNGNGAAHAYSGGSNAPEEIISRLPKSVRDLIATAKEAGQRSEHCFHTMQVLFEHGLTNGEVRLVADGAPFAAKYAERGDLDAEIARGRAKWMSEGAKRVAEAGDHAKGASNGTSKKGSGDGRKPTQADTLIEIATGDEVDLFHTPDGTAYADIIIDGHRETWSLKSQGFRRWIRREYYQKTGGSPNSNAMTTAMGTLDARAHFDGPERQVHLRVVEHAGRIYLDLCDPLWRVAEITPNGWEIISDPPVRFRRTSGMLPLPIPEKGANLEQELRKHLNVDDDGYKLAVSFLLATLRGRGPFPVWASRARARPSAGRCCAALWTPAPPRCAPCRATSMTST